MTHQRTTLRHRICVAALGTSLGVLATTASAQVPQGSNAGRAIGDAIGNQLQRGSTDPVQRGTGEAIRGAIQGQSAGDAVQRGLGEAARSAGETPQQTLQRDRFETGQIYQDGRFDQQNRVYQDGRFDQQGRVYQDGRVYRDGRVYQQDGRVYQQDGRGYQQGGRVYQEERFRAGDGYRYDSQDGRASGRVEVGAQQRARLGVTMNDTDRGVVVKNVARGTAAAQANLQPGDVILDVNGQQVSSPQDMVRLIGQRSPGDQVVLNVLRDGEEQRINATLTSAQGSEGYRANRPAMSGQSDDAEQLRQQVEMLQQEVQDLRSQLQQAGGEASADSTQLDAEQRARAGADLRSDEGINTEGSQRLEGDATLDRGSLDLDADQDARAGAEADRAGAIRGGLEAEGSLGADADDAADLDLDVDTEGGADASAGEL